MRQLPHSFCLLAISVLLFSSPCIGQNYFNIDSVEINVSPTPSDSGLLIFTHTTPNQSTPVKFSIVEKQDTLEVEKCLHDTGWTATDNYRDSIKIPLNDSLTHILIIVRTSHTLLDFNCDSTFNCIDTLELEINKVPQFVVNLEEEIHNQSIDLFVLNSSQIVIKNPVIDEAVSIELFLPTGEILFRKKTIIRKRQDEVISIPYLNQGFYILRLDGKITGSKIKKLLIN